MTPDDTPVKDGDRLKDWDDAVFTVRNVIPDGENTKFDAHYDDGSVVERYIWNEPDFTHVTSED